MSPDFTKRSSGVYLVACDDGSRCVVYNASRIGNPQDHEPDKWYFLPYPAPLGLEPGEPFATADEAERAARARHTRSDGAPISAEVGRHAESHHSGQERTQTGYGHGA